MGPTGAQSGGDILQQVLLLVIGAAIGLVSSLVTLLVAEYLSNRRQEKLLAHERALWGGNRALDSAPRSKDRELKVRWRRSAEIVKGVGIFQWIFRIGLLLGLVVLVATLVLLAKSVHEQPKPVMAGSVYAAQPGDTIPSSASPTAMVTPPAQAETLASLEPPSNDQTATALALAGATSAPPPGLTPQPTDSPAPAGGVAPQYRFGQVSQQGWPNCGSTGIKVYFKTRSGQPYPGIQFAVYAGGACVGLSPRAKQVDGAAEFTLSPDRARAGSWEVRAVKTAHGENGTGVCGPITWIMSASIPVMTLDSPCDPNSSGVQWVWLTLQEN